MRAEFHQERLHGLDAARGIALILGVGLHAALSFLPGPQVWIVADTQPSGLLGLAAYVIHIFRMAVFFLIAGFFGHMALHRLGLKGFVKDRLKRIALPLVVGWPILFVLIVVATIWAAMVANGVALPKRPSSGPAFTPGDFPLTHLWFLYLLLLFYAATLLVRIAVNAIDGKGRLRAAADRLMRMVVTIWAPMLLAVPLCISLFFYPKWMMLAGIPTPDNSLYPNIPALVGYGTAFGLGWLLHRQIDLIRAWELRWPVHIALAIVATVASLAIGGGAPETTPAAQDARKLAYAACYSLALWSWSFGLIGMALRFLSGFSAARRYIADASYWIYLIHLPLIIALQGAVSRLSWPWVIKFSLILAVGFPLMILSYHWMVRYSFIGAVLNGTRKERPGKSS